MRYLIVADPELTPMGGKLGQVLATSWEAEVVTPGQVSPESLSSGHGLAIINLGGAPIPDGASLPDAVSALGSWWAVSAGEARIWTESREGEDALQTLARVEPQLRAVETEANATVARWRERGRAVEGTGARLVEIWMSGEHAPDPRKTLSSAQGHGLGRALWEHRVMLAVNHFLLNGFDAFHLARLREANRGLY